MDIRLRQEKALRYLEKASYRKILKKRRIFWSILAGLAFILGVLL